MHGLIEAPVAHPSPPARSVSRRAAAALLCLLLTASVAEGAARRAAPAPRPLGPATPSWIVIHAASGEPVDSREPDRPGAPASMTKMMLALVVLEAVRDGQLKLDDAVPTSRLASKMGGSQVYLKEGESFSVEEMLAALLIGSANDAAVALAERLTGNAEATVRVMNDRAAALKLENTRFGTVHGLPPGPGQTGDVTTPRDMARLGQEILKHPAVLKWTGSREAPFRDGRFLLRNSNHLIGQFPGADGIKTGHFAEAGYNVAATAARGGLRLIAVVMGAASNSARFAEASRLLGEGFARYAEVTVVKAEAPVGEEVRLPRAKFPFKPMASSEVRIAVKREDRDRIKSSVELSPDVRAPLKRGDAVGTLIVRVGEHEVGRTPLVAPVPIPRAVFWWLTPWR